MRALVIDDSRTMRSLLHGILAPAGFEVVEACNGRDALEHLNQIGIPEVALVDWNMPVMDGFAFVQAVRAEPRYAEMRLMMVTTVNEQASLKSAMAAGADEYVMKPFTREVILEKLEMLGLVPTPSAPAESPRKKTPHALVIDDARAMRRILHQIMQELGFEVTEASNGREGLEQLQRLGVPDVALVDSQMPEMDGLTFLKAVRANPDYQRLPVVMVTGADEKAHVTQALAAGANEYVVKPFDKAIILQKLGLLGVPTSIS